MLLFCLVILVILLAGGVAVMRSMSTSLSSAGNLAFKRDMVNQGEQAAANALALLRTGALAATGSNIADLRASNYSATHLPSNARGIPEALLTDTAFATKGVSSNDVTRDGVRVRYLVDRLCNTTGPATPESCVYTPANSPKGGDVEKLNGNIPVLGVLIYRLSVRVDGPRNTQVFLQSSFTNPN